MISYGELKCDIKESGFFLRGGEGGGGWGGGGGGGLTFSPIPYPQYIPL